MRPLCVFLLSVWFSPANAQKGIDVVGIDPVAGEVKGDRWAVVVGINKYEHVASLRFCVADAHGVFGTLTSRACGSPARNVRLLVDDAPESSSKPSRSNFIAALSKWLQLPRANDLVIVYFSGHGRDYGEESYLLTCDALDDQPELTGVSLDYVRKQLQLCKARRKLLVLDMCHSGGRGENAMGDATGWRHAARRTAWHLGLRDTSGCKGVAAERSRRSKEDIAEATSG